MALSPEHLADLQRSGLTAEMKSAAFFHDLFRYCSGQINVRVLAPGGKVFNEFYDITSFNPELIRSQHAGRNIYFGVATRNGGGTKNDIVDIPAAWIDVDFKDTPEEDAISRLNGFPLKPSCIVSTGGGFHVYWHFREPLDKGDIPAVERMLKRLAAYFKGDRAATDASRVLRLPGSFNQKYDPPRPVRIISLQDHRYSIDDFDDLLPALKESARESTGSTYTRSEQTERLMQCAFMRHCADNSASLSEPLWFAMISNGARVSPGGPELCHELSRDYPKYTRQETDTKILHAMNGSAAITCRQIKEYGFDCKMECEVKAPIGLLWRKKEASQAAPSDTIKIISASDWLATEPPAADQVLEGVFDTGDKFALIGSSKLRKSFFLLMLCMCLAAGRTFLGWAVPKKRRVLLVQMEIKEHHFHRRSRRMAQGIGISPEDLEDRLRFINARGLGIIGPEGIARIRGAVEEFMPEVIVFDPLYKVATGVENASEDMKGILACFDQLAEQTGAAVGYVHHDPKGSPGDRDIRDRGAGSNVLGRDYDACVTLTAHAQDPDSAVVEVLLRNYRPQEPFAITWTETDVGGYAFEVLPDVLPDKKTSRTKAAPPALATYMPTAASILGDEEMEMAPFKVSFKTKTGLGDNRIRDFITWATAGGNPYIVTREVRGYRTHEKWLRVGKRYDAE